MVVIEVSFSHDTPAHELATEYIKSGTHAVIFVDLEYRSPTQRAASAASSVPSTAVYSIFRRLRTQKPNGKYAVRTECVVNNQPFLTNTSDPDTISEGHLALWLSDFCPTDRLSRDDEEDTAVRVSHTKLAAILAEAEEEQMLYDSHQPGLDADEDYESDEPVKRAADASFSSCNEDPSSQENNLDDPEWKPSGKTKKART
ncbi:hypothetical protein BU26DRAFT_570226 [Trematosphaeria pertusa]|uniref:Uncharacterized protein n=1 Tax=Trematosphaeria pertusa TaxID=390896 RepID=A0A6A6HZA1_9PLEO|nr:uncharacterized protein BU26DRAFT_570226 [Trematosphaeria pertusa]KAF2243535.1 hypothetical protein BU26DRAFT_570226 [Trematosphaeria pertusa]